MEVDQIDFSNSDNLQLRAIRKESARHDLFHRLHSIAADEAFVRQVSTDWFRGWFDIVPNQRCGNWYCRPATSSAQYAYFKSTDGHTNNWSFNLRRANLGLAKHAETKGGFILVDSTRRGKRMPDALSKTVPIWCAVLNRAVAAKRRASVDPTEWDTELYVPSNIVSPSEKFEIEKRLDGWVKALLDVHPEIPDLVKPLRPFFVHPATSMPPAIPDDPRFIPVICLSASRSVGVGGDEVPSSTRLRDGSTVGFDYVPGAGDDDELWAKGLTPAMFHAHMQELLHTERPSLQRTVEAIVQRNPVAPQYDSSRTRATAHPDSPVMLDSPLMAIGDTSLLLRAQNVQAHERPAVDRIFNVSIVDKPVAAGESIVQSGLSSSTVAIASVRSHPRSYEEALRHLASFVRSQGSDLASVTLRATHSFSDTKDITAPHNRYVGDIVQARKTIVPLALLLLCLPPFISDDGTVDKPMIARQLQRLVTIWPDSNPPRAALTRVNEVLMGRKPP